MLTVQIDIQLLIVQPAIHQMLVPLLIERICRLAVRLPHRLVLGLPAQ